MLTASFQSSQTSSTPFPVSAMSVVLPTFPAGAIAITPGVGPSDTRAGHNRSVQSAPVMVVSDMDGTLLNELGVVTGRTAAALKRADAAGARVVIATGRPVW